MKKIILSFFLSGLLCGCLPVTLRSNIEVLSLQMQIILRDHPEIGRGITKIANLKYSPLVGLGAFSLLNYRLAAFLPKENSIAGHVNHAHPSNTLTIVVGKALSLLSGASLLASYAGFSKKANEKLIAASVFSNLAAFMWNVWSIDSVDTKQRVWIASQDAQEALIADIKLNNVQSVQELIRNGVPANRQIASVTDGKWRPIFHAACLDDGAAMIDVLKNAYKYEPRRDGCWFASRDDYVVSCTSANGDSSPLDMATSVATAQALIEWNKRVLHHKDGQGRTPLHLVQSIDLATLFLDNGANIDSKDKQGKTPLHTAIEEKKYDIAKLLIERGANVSLSIQGEGGFFWTVEALIRYQLVDQGVREDLLAALDRRRARNTEESVTALAPAVI